MFLKFYQPLGTIIIVFLLGAIRNHDTPRGLNFIVAIYTLAVIFVWGKKKKTVTDTYTLLVVKHGEKIRLKEVKDTNLFL